MIPVLGIPVINREDMLLDMIKSIDFPVEKLAIVQNANHPELLEVIQTIRSGINPHVKSVYVSIPFRNLGVAPSWNHIIKSFPESSFWLLPSVDIKFASGDLEKIYTSHLENPDTFIFVSGFACFGLTPSVIKKVGLFDENFYPCYYEDNDYHRRMKLVEVPEVQVAEIGNIHPDGSQTIGSNPTYRIANGATFALNYNYYLSKWGENGISHDYNHMHVYPFGDPSRNVKDWTYDNELRRTRNYHWGDMENTANKTIFKTT